MKVMEVVAERAVGANVTRFLSVLAEMGNVPYKGLVLEASYSPSPVLPPCRISALGPCVKLPAP